MSPVVLSVAPGSGRLARRPDGLLYAAGSSGALAWAPVIDAYLAAADADAAREAVTAAALGARFALGPFALVSWGAGIELLVLGELTVHTDLPTAPALCGTGATTWVEHRVPRPPERARLCAGAPAEPDTRLDAGVVAAGGFALSIGVATARRRTGAPLPPPELSRPLPAPNVSPPLPAGIAPDDDPEMTLRPPSPAAPQPTLGRLVLPDGSAIDVNATLVIGRRPDARAARATPEATLVALDVSADVSRTHLVVRAEGWMMTATDCGSRGRTVLRCPGVDEPVVLEPWVAHEIGPGDTLYLGGPTQLQISEHR